MKIRATTFRALPRTMTALLGTQGFVEAVQGYWRKVDARELANYWSGVPELVRTNADEGLSPGSGPRRRSGAAVACRLASGPGRPGRSGRPRARRDPRGGEAGRRSGRAAEAAGGPGRAGGGRRDREPLARGDRSLRAAEDRRVDRHARGARRPDPPLRGGPRVDRE